jgi:thymidylate synthase
MEIIRTRNVHSALPQALRLLKTRGVVANSRNGQVLRMVEPVVTIYDAPTERVEFHPWRNSNPFFHFYESLWMLAGRDDIRPLVRYAKQMGEYSDDGHTQNAAYGHRWRHAGAYERFSRGRDQLKLICDALRKDHDTRQQVLQIWDHEKDLGTTTKDHACNVAATFQIMSDRLDMVVFCRSNDVVWGCYGSNAVHFSMLLEYVARRVGVSVGTYTQISVNWHAYVDKTAEMMIEVDKISDVNPYAEGRFLDPTTPIAPYPIALPGTSFARWDTDCAMFVTDTGMAPTEKKECRDWLPFFREVAWPIVEAHDLYKSGAINDAIAVASTCAATDWRLSCVNWLIRRQARRVK